jgi:hypothetical protein
MRQAAVSDVDARNVTLVTDTQSTRTNNILQTLQQTTNQLRAMLALTNKYITEADDKDQLSMQSIQPVSARGDVS